MRKLLFNDTKVIQPGLIFVFFGGFICFCFFLSDLNTLVKWNIIILIMVCCSLPYLFQLLRNKKVLLDYNQVIISNIIIPTNFLPLSDISKIEILGFFGLPIYNFSSYHGHRRFNYGYSPGYVTVNNEVVIKNKFIKFLIYNDNEIIFSYYIKNNISKHDYIFELLNQNIDREFGWKIDIKFNEGFDEEVKIVHFKTIDEANKTWIMVRYL